MGPPYTHSLGREQNISIRIAGLNTENRTRDFINVSLECCFCTYYINVLCCICIAASLLSLSLSVWRGQVTSNSDVVQVCAVWTSNRRSKTCHDLERCRSAGPKCVYLLHCSDVTCSNLALERFFIRNPCPVSAV